MVDKCQALVLESFIFFGKRHVETELMMYVLTYLLNSHMLHVGGLLCQVHLFCFLFEIGLTELAKEERCSD